MHKLGNLCSCVFTSHTATMFCSSYILYVFEYSISNAFWLLLKIRMTFTRFLSFFWPKERVVRHHVPQLVNYGLADTFHSCCIFAMHFSFSLISFFIIYFHFLLLFGLMDMQESWLSFCDTELLILWRLDQD